jgi:hypothetical protein
VTDLQPSGGEVQLLVQMVSDVRGLVQDVDRKLDRMVPRPEFEQFQHAIDQRFTAFEARIAEKQSAHNAIEAKIDAVDTKVDAHESERNKNYRDLNTKVWLAIVGAILAIAGGFIVRALGGG